LDFGHWAAHKLEALSGWTLRHGEAVAMGMALDVCCACRAGWLSQNSARRILHLLHRLGFSLYSPLMEQKAADGQWALWQGLQEFREHLGGQLRLTMLREIGASFETDHLQPEWVEEAVDELKQLEAAPPNS
jgi:3-dehydroquinate synthase